jgi:DNA invertase Pin-like site-specific DNA recombinase
VNKAIGYIRVSTAKQANEGISLEAQAAKIRAYCELNDLELLTIIEDAGKTGTNMTRAGIQEAMQMLQAGQADALVVYKLDRLSRKTADTLSAIEAIEQAGAAFHSITEKVDAKSDLGKFFLTTTAAFAEMESNAISTRTKEALSYKKSQGQHLGGVPFGYRLNGQVLDFSPQETAIIARVVTLRNAGQTLQQIADVLNAEGIATKRGGRWYPTTVKNVLGAA